MFKDNKKVLKLTTLLMTIVMFAMVILPAIPILAVETNPYTAKSEELIQNIYDKYMENGKVSAASNTELDGFAIYVLNEANVDVLNWEYEGETVEDKLVALLDESTYDSLDAKRVAYLYIAAESVGKTTEASDLLNILKNRQKNTTNGGFLDGDFSEFTNLPAFDILATAGKLDELEEHDKAFEYVRDLNPTISDYPDFMTIGQTARALNGFDKIASEEKIETILEWLKEKQNLDGSFNVGGDDAVTNTSEVLWTINSIGITTTLTEDDRDNAIGFLIEKESFANIGANIWALRSLLLNGANPNFNPAGGNGGVEEPLNTVTIRIEGPDYTILPETELEVDGEKSYSDIIIENATELGYTVQESGGFLNSINDIPGQTYWAVTPYQESYTDGDSFILYGGGTSDIVGEITLSKTTAEPRDSFTATVKYDNGDPVEGATVIYYKEANRTSPIVAGVTDLMGKINLSIDTEGKYYLAAHKINTGVWPEPDNGLVRTLPKTITIQKIQPPTPPVVDRIRVDVAVIDDDGKVIYGPKSVRLYSDDKYGLTVRGALEETGLKYDTAESDRLVVEIERVKNRGLSGWMYAVNGKAPGVSANDKTVKDRDEVLWYYSKSASAKVPKFPDEKEKEKEEETEKDKDKDKVVSTPNYVIPPRITFTDVGANISWAKDSIEILAGRGIIAGTGTGQFEPNRSINRAEFAKLVVETLGDKSLNQGVAMFSDVDSTKWYAEYIGRAFTKGLIEGSNGKFRPMESITRNEVAVILHRMQNRVVPNSGIISFKDEATIPEWARLSVAYALERGLIKGYNDNTFRGDQPMTRAEVAVVLHRYIQMMNL